MVSAESLLALARGGPDEQALAGALHLADLIDTIKAISRSLGNG